LRGGGVIPALHAVSSIMRLMLLCLFALALSAAEPWSEKMTITAGTSSDLTLTLADGTTATMRVYHPGIPSLEAYPVVIFSHGLAGSKEGYDFLGKLWANHGYVSIHPDHPGSDTAAFRGKRLPEIGPALKAATQDPAILAGRPALVRKLIDALPQIQERLHGIILDRERIGIAGHSFGAWTTMQIAGMRGPLAGSRDGEWSDPRPKAFIALSPNGPGVLNRDGELSHCTRPMLIMTGSDDRQPAVLSPAGVERSGAWRRQTFDQLPPGEKMLAWFDGARHCTYSAGAGNIFIGEPPPDPAQVEAVAVITLAWWEACLRDDASAKKWLADPATPAWFGTWAKFEHR
ncbi:MAG TPA: alpha/beta fold hydrolase, partial [Planctomycetota bacterium]|nr:alpha/beta fold hydrolase [Planctomycetota bacterium]